MAHPICFFGHLRKAEVHLLVLRCLNLYSLNELIVDHFCLVPPYSLVGIAEWLASRITKQEGPGSNPGGGKEI